MANYDVKRVDLSTVQADRAPIIESNRGISAVMVLAMPAGAAPLLYIGDGPGIPIFAGFATDICPEELAGVWYTNPTGTLGTLVVLVSFGGLSPATV